MRVDGGCVAYLGARIIEKRSRTGRQALLTVAGLGVKRVWGRWARKRVMKRIEGAKSGKTREREDQPLEWLRPGRLAATMAQEPGKDLLWWKMKREKSRRPFDMSHLSRTYYRHETLALADPGTRLETGASGVGGWPGLLWEAWRSSDGLQLQQTSSQGVVPVLEPTCPPTTCLPTYSHGLPITLPTNSCFQVASHISHRIRVATLPASTACPVCRTYADRPAPAAIRLACLPAVTAACWLASPACALGG